jgi:hypothetical protein
MHTKYNAQNDVQKKLNIKHLNCGHSYETCTSNAQFLNQSARTDHIHLKYVHMNKSMADCLTDSKLIHLQ